MDRHVRAGGITSPADERATATSRGYVLRDADDLALAA
jgi:hypothetical protein